jgi:adenylate kinase
MSNVKCQNLKRYNILIFGPQGSGKGTQAQMLSKLLNIPHISPGVIFRQIQKEQGRFGADFAKLVQSYLDQGKLVPDEHTNKLVIDRISQPDCQHGFILDGYPRNKFQADFLTKQTDIGYIIVINLPDKEGVTRIADRRVCENGHSYHKKFAPSKEEGICDFDGLPLYQRSDETEEAIKKRLEIYHRETEPLIDDFRAQGVKIIEIDGRPSIEEVSREIKRKLNLS